MAYKPKLSEPPEKYQPDWLQELDGRTVVAQLMKERFAEVASDLGGYDGLSYFQRSLISRYLWQEHWLMQQERAIAGGEEVDMGKYVQAVNSAQGLAAKLGLHRVARDVPDLASYLKKREASQ